jgi:hypothetical protein
MKKYKLNIIDKRNNILKAFLEVLDESDGVTLTLRIKESNVILEEKNTFPFVALCELRKKIEKEGRKICCKGSRLDVYPSGRMLVGFNAYKLKLGSPTQNEDIVGLFEEEELYDKIATVEDQETYFNNWLSSI